MLSQLVYDDGHLVRTVMHYAPARASLAGNPSDLAEPQGIGAVVSMPIWKYKAVVTIQPAEDFRINAPCQNDATFADKVKNLNDRGVGDWENIVDQAIKTFTFNAKRVGAKPLPFKGQVNLSTNIPRQRGLSGSSGVILCVIQCLVEIHDLVEHPAFSGVNLAEMVLSVEHELNLKGAGKQDRILQVMANEDQGLNAVVMNFANQRYEAIEIGMDEFPSMALILSDEPSHSGAAHDDMKSRLEAGDESALIGMRQIAKLGLAAAAALKRRQWGELGSLMRSNARRRVELYGSDCLGPINMMMLEACERTECPANFTGSGGAFVCILPDGKKSFERLRAELLGFQMEMFN